MPLQLLFFESLKAVQLCKINQNLTFRILDKNKVKVKVKVKSTVQAIFQTDQTNLNIKIQIQLHKLNLILQNQMRK